MDLPNTLSVVLLLLGGLATLTAAWQLYKRGLISWLIILIIGLTSINYGLSSKLSRFSQEKLKEACGQVALPE